jgi:hypothetical protein
LFCCSRELLTVSQQFSAIINQRRHAAVQLSVNILSAIIHCSLVSRDLAVRISAICAPRVPWSDMALHLQTPPTSRLLLPHRTSCFCGHFFNYVMMSVLNRRSCTMARKTEITVLFAKVCNADKRLSDWIRANHDNLLAEVGSGRILSAASAGPSQYLPNYC